MKALVAIAAFLSIATAHGDEYKCIENGKTIYTNLPCTSQPAKPNTVAEVEKTAAQIQAEFERERADREREKKQIEDVVESTRAAQEAALKQESKPVVTTASVSARKSESIDWGWITFILFICSIPGFVASSRNHHNAAAIWALSLLLGWTLLGWVVALVWSLTAKQSAPIKYVQAPDLTEPEERPDPQTEKLLSDIRHAIEAHAEAFDLLQILSRIDGTRTSGEGTIIFEFLRRQGTGLEQKHRPLYSRVSAEWYAPGTDTVIDSCLKTLRSKPQHYRLEVTATATAIVAIGGEPKRREAELLDKIRATLSE